MATMDHWLLELQLSKFNFNGLIIITIFSENRYYFLFVFIWNQYSAKLLKKFMYN